MANPLESAWHSRSGGDRYVTHGGEVRRIPGAGWFAKVNEKARGPLSSMDAAFAAADAMISQAAQKEGAAA